MKRREVLARNILRRMGEIDGHVAISAYRPLKDGEQDLPPTGDDFNLLWDAILDEVRAACPGLDYEAEIRIGGAEGAK